MTTPTLERPPLVALLPACPHCHAPEGVACRPRCTGEQLYAADHGYGLGYLGCVVSSVMGPLLITETVTSLGVAPGCLVQLVPDEAGQLQPAAVRTPDRERLPARVLGARRVGRRWAVTVHADGCATPTLLDVASHQRWQLVVLDES